MKKILLHIDIQRHEKSFKLSMKNLATGRVNDENDLYFENGKRNKSKL